MMATTTNMAILGLFALILATTPQALAQTNYDDGVIGSTSPIPDTETRHTYGKDYDGLTPGRGREEVYYAFSPCLKTAWILQQQLTPSEWQVQIAEMAAQCGIAPLGADESGAMLEYLARYYGPPK
jgi:hypothetical protein